ncbi:MAG TPA: M28 family peptidase, partial [Phycisphaerae bacterium]|nr:M28 family peptidase [Phycisphaerae bacterium]
MDANEPIRRQRLIQGGGLWWLSVGAAAIVATVVLSAVISRPKDLTLEMSTAVEAGVQGDLSVERMSGLIDRLASLGSRVTGQGGDRAALEIVLEQLRATGIDEIQVQDFPVAAPVSDSAALTAPGADGPVTVRLHPLWPNLARTSQTPPAGLTGPLVYVGAGDDDDLAGKTLAGAILVFDWDSDRQWLGAGEFGAKAVIFRAADQGSGYTARNKFLTVPANVPRFYVGPADVAALDALAKQQAPATIHCRQAWRAVTASNILAQVTPGDPAADPDKPDQAPIVLHAYYDSISVVPSLSPGAEQACGAAAVVELARFLRQMPTPPRRPVYALLTGGHGQGLAGMTHFLSELRRELAEGAGREKAETVLGRMGKPGLFVGLDLSSRSDRMGVFCAGSFRGQPIQRLRPKYSVLGQKLNAFAAGFADGSDDQEPGGLVDCINLTLGRGWWTYFPYAAAFESELATMAQMPAITLATINDDRRYVDTPQDTPSRMRMDLFARQVLCEPRRRAGLANLVLALGAWRGPFVSSGLPNQWAAVAGRVVWLDQRTDYTPNKPLTRAVVFLKTGQGEKFLMGTRGGAAAITDDDGAFRFDGLIKAAANWQFNNCLVEAYGPATEEFLAANPDAVGEYRKVLARARRDPVEIDRDGGVLFAVDMARAKEYPWRIKVVRAEQHLNLVCFPCKAVSLFALTDPREYIDLSDLQILDAATQSPPFQFGQSATDMPTGRSEANCVSLWADPTLRVRLTFGFGFQKRRLILTGATPDNPEGEGFLLEELETVPSMVLQGAGDMWALDEFRIDRLTRHGISNPRVRQIHAESAECLDRARDALGRGDYRTYREAAENGWALEGKAYGELLSITNNMIRGVLFYLAVLIPFSYCLERLLLAGGTIRRRIGGMTAIFAVSFAVLAAVHPAFRFTLTPLIVLLAFLILSLAATVSFLLTGRFDRMLQEQKAAATGF